MITLSASHSLEETSSATRASAPRSPRLSIIVCRHLLPSHWLDFRRLATPLPAPWERGVCVLRAKMVPGLFRREHSHRESIWGGGTCWHSGKRESVIMVRSTCTRVTPVDEIQDFEGKKIFVLYLQDWCYTVLLFFHFQDYFAL